MPKSAFILSHGHGYTLGSTWTWRVCELVDEAGRRGRLLVAFDRGKQQYRAMLGLVDGEEMAIVARLEFHPSHHFWHCHVKTSVLSDLPRGVVKESRSHERVLLCQAKIFDVTESNAIGYAFRVFNVTPESTGGLA